MQRGYCATHSNAKEKGQTYNYRWRKARLRYLREHPLCVHCLQDGRVTAATDLDHKVPHRGNQELFWNQDNWQALCARCHGIKTAQGL